MVQALVLMFEGGAAWDRIVLKAHAFARVLFMRLLPMMIITAVLEGLTLARWGKWQPNFNHLKKFSTYQVIGYESVQFIMNLLMIFVCALVVRSLGRTFHGRVTYTFTRSFTLVVCGLSPMFLLRLLDILPIMNPYVSWALGIVLSIWVLYDGLPRLLAPDPTHAFGLYLSCAFVLFLATGLVRLVTALYLRGDAGFSHSFLGHSLNQLLGK